MIKIFKINLIFFLIVIASPASYSNSDMSDPYENSNRSIHEFNDKIDVYLLRPVSVGYSLLPNPIEVGISNILQNSGEPINFTNYILQGEIKNALSSLMRFIINSSFGLLGTIDLADQLNLKKNDTDFDKTLEKWGAGEGNYLVLPFIGPRSSRHLAGSIIDIALNPLNYFLKDEDDIIRISPTMLYAVSARSGNMETIDNLRETSIDYYSSLKSIYYQSRSSGLNESLDEQVFDDFFESLEVENKND